MTIVSGSDLSNVREKMIELRQNQKADVVLKQEAGGCMALSIRSYECKYIAFLRSCGRGREVVQ